MPFHLRLKWIDAHVKKCIKMFSRMCHSDMCYQMSYIQQSIAISLLHKNSLITGFGMYYNKSNFYTFSQTGN